MKKKCLVTICLLLTIILYGCSGSKKEQGSGDTIVVYYMKNHLFYENALHEYQKENKDIQLDLRGFESADELAKQYSAEGFSKGGADLILLDAESKIDMNKIIQSNHCFDMTDYINNDETYQADTYFGKVLDAGVYDGKQYMLPISFDMGIIFARDTVYQTYGSDFIKGEDFYAFSNELLEFQEQMYDSDEIRLGLLPFQVETDELLQYIYHVSGFQVIKDGKVAIDKGKLKSLCDFIIEIQKEFNDKFDEMQNTGSNSAALVGFDMIYGNPASLIRGFEYSMELVTGDGIGCDGIPSEDVGKYHATVREFGFINSKSSVSYEAYQILRYLMDYDQYDFGADAGVPIRSELYFRQLDELRKIDRVTWNNTLTYVSPMSDENYNKIIHMAENIGSASLINPDLEVILTESMSKYINGTEEFDVSYQQLSNRLELYLKE